MKCLHVRYSVTAVINSETLNRIRRSLQIFSPRPRKSTANAVLSSLSGVIRYRIALRFREMLSRTLFRCSGNKRKYSSPNSPLLTNLLTQTTQKHSKRCALFFVGVNRCITPHYSLPYICAGANRIDKENAPARARRKLGYSARLRTEQYQSPNLIPSCEAVYRLRYFSSTAIASSAVFTPKILSSSISG